MCFLDDAGEKKSNYGLQPEICFYLIMHFFVEIEKHEVIEILTNAFVIMYNNKKGDVKIYQRKNAIEIKVMHLGNCFLVIFKFKKTLFLINE